MYAPVGTGPKMPLKGKVHFKTFFADSNAEYVVMT